MEIKDLKVEYTVHETKQPVIAMAQYHKKLTKQE